MIIRRMQDHDVDGVALLEQAAPSPWSPASIAAELLRPHSVQLVAEESGTGTLLGWCCAILAGFEAELLKIAVARSNRRQGIATQLLQRLCKHLRDCRVASLYLEVRQRNRPAQALYMRTGFVEVGLRPGYYLDPVDNALIFRKELLYSGGGENLNEEESDEFPT